VTPGPHIALIGSMGSGKSTVGERVAALLGLPFHDNDELLRRATGSTAHDLAGDVGLDGLHELEAEVVATALASGEPSVVATAASVVEHDRCRTALGDRAFTVWLRAEPSVLAERAACGSHRPLDADAGTQLRRLAARRDPLYAAAGDLVVDVGALDAGQAADEVVRAARAAGLW